MVGINNVLYAKQDSPAMKQLRHMRTCIRTMKCLIILEGFVIVDHPLTCKCSAFGAGAAVLSSLHRVRAAGLCNICLTHTS